MRQDSNFSPMSLLAKCQGLGWRCQPCCLGGGESDFLHPHAAGEPWCNFGVQCVNE